MKHLASIIDFFVHTPYNVYTLKQIPSTISILQLKARIELRAGIPVEHQLLNLSGTCLDDNSLISETGIKKGSVVRLLFSSKIVEKLFEMTNIEDIVGLLNAGVQVIDLSQAASFNDRNRLITWNKNAMQRAFLAVCVACFNGSLDLLDSLLKYCALDLNQVTAWGRSALHFAAARGSIGCVCLLLDRGIDACIQDMDERTAQDIASELGHIHCKRRIWLYRWNIKPTLRRDKKRRRDQDEDVRFPILGARTSLTPNEISYIQDSRVHEDTKELPRVLSRKSVNSFARASVTSLESIRQNTAPASSIVETTREQSPQLELHHMDSSNSIDSIANDENQTKEETDWENKDELQLLKQLAEKYGYTIVDNRNGSRLGQNQKTDSVESVVRVQKSKSMLERDDKIQQQVSHSTDRSERKESETNRVNKRASIIRKISLLEKKKEGDNGLPVTASNETEVNKKNSEIHKSDLEKQRVGGSTEQSKEKAVFSLSSKSSFKTQEINKDKPRISETGKIKAESETKKPPLEKTSKEEWQSNENSETRIGRVELNTGNDEAKRDSKSTFERWLERKSAQKRESSAKETSEGNESEKRRDMCDQAFKKWLQLKKVRYRSASVSPRPSFQESRREVKRPKSGLSFETWMKGKGKVQPRSLSMTETTTHLPVKRAYSSGITYSEWIDSKRSQFKPSLQNAEEENSNEAVSPNRVRLNGITFENWVEAKTKQFQIERVEKDTEKMRLEYEKEMEYERKLKNSNVKTFEDWLFEKEFEDRIRKTKEKKAKRKSRKNKTKYEEDSNLVYNMWLMNKHISEMEKEEENLNALRKEWERKKEMQLKIGTEMEKAEVL